MKPVVAIVGRTNVGKSTLFNRLTGTRDALVADQPGLTRDRKTGNVRVDDRCLIVVDTGGLGDDDSEMAGLVANQTLQAAREADAVLFIVDGRAGLTGEDERIGGELRRIGKPVYLAVNKCEGLDPNAACADFFALGLGTPHPISSAHGDGVGDLLELVAEALPQLAEEDGAGESEGIRVAIIGRPNVGKSTLVNRILGEERVLTFDQPGTTRDSIAAPFERDGTAYTLVDTAGVRRRARVSEPIERFSVVKTLQAIDEAQVVILVIDAREGVTEQDASLLGMILDSGRALLIAVNKWDGLERSDRERVKAEVERKLHFIDFARVYHISALHGTGVGNLFPSIQAAWRSAFANPSTAQLTRLLEQAVAAHPPPMVRGRRIKLRYAHLGGHNPPMVVVHGNQTESVPESYRRYLEKFLREALALEGTPVRIVFRHGENPFKGRPNPLNERQVRKRKRLIRHVKQRGR